MGYVYLICDPANDRFKIGVTRKFDSNRVKKLQTGNSTELFVRYMYETKWPFRLEKFLHNKYANKRILNEWFAPDIHDVNEFFLVCKQQEDIIRALKDNPFFGKYLK